jgi:hypothetical protein
VFKRVGLHYIEFQKSGPSHSATCRDQVSKNRQNLSVTDEDRLTVIVNWPALLKKGTAGQ